MTKFELISYVEKVCYENYAMAYYDDEIHHLNPPCNIYKLEKPLSEVGFYLFSTIGSSFEIVFDKM